MIARPIVVPLSLIRRIEKKIAPKLGWVKPVCVFRLECHCEKCTSDCWNIYREITIGNKDYRIEAPHCQNWRFCGNKIDIVIFMERLLGKYICSFSEIERMASKRGINFIHELLMQAKIKPCEHGRNLSVAHSWYALRDVVSIVSAYGLRCQKCGSKKSWNWECYPRNSKYPFAYRPDLGQLPKNIESFCGPLCSRKLPKWRLEQCELELQEQRKRQQQVNEEIKFRNQVRTLRSQMKAIQRASKTRDLEALSTLKHQLQQAETLGD